MSSADTHTSPPLDFPNRLASPQPDRRTPPRAGKLLALLLLLAIVPRGVMALKLHSICPDGVLYIQLAQALERGDFRAALHEMRLNTYPVVLAVLHHAGLDYETAGKLWGVTMAGLVVLPLFGWARRIFNDRVALVACLLYAFHGKLIVWSPELIRDQTFWFLWALALYWLWRAVVEVRLKLFAAAGIVIALAALTRVEGLFLVIPALLWPFWRWRALHGGRRRLALGVALSLLVFPLLLALVNFTLLRGHTGFELPRSRPLTLVQAWLESWRHGEVRSDVEALSTTAQLGWLFVHNGESGLSPVFALLMFGGLWRWRRVWMRCDQQTMFVTSLAFQAGIWIHLQQAHATSNRYFLPIVLIGSGYAALALLGLGHGLAALTARLIGRALPADWPGRLTAALLVAIAALGCADAIGSNYRVRDEEPQLGRWIRQQVGAPPTLMGPEGAGLVVNYYAGGRESIFPFEADDQLIFTEAVSQRPDVVLLMLTRRMQRSQPDRYASLIERLSRVGYRHVQAAELPAHQDRILVLLRRPAVAATPPAATALARRPLPATR